MAGRARWSASWAALVLCATGLVLVQNAAATASDPSLDIRSVKVRPGTVLAGGTTRVKIKVRNAGSRPVSPKPLAIRLIGVAAVLAKAKTPTIPAGTTRAVVVDVTIPVGTTSGKRTLRACVSKGPRQTCTAVAADAPLTVLAPARVTVSDPSYSFGAATVGTTVSKTFTITNTGGVPTGTLATTLDSGVPGQFGTTADTCAGHTLAGAASCSVTVAFHPTTAGAKTATLTVSATPGGSAVASLSGTGADGVALAFTPAQKNYGAVAIQTVAQQAFTLTNNGNVTSGVLNLLMSGLYANQFAVSNDTCSGNTLVAGASCSLTVSFLPTTTGAKNASVQATTAAGASAVAALTGTGANPASLTIYPPPQPFGNVAVGSSASQVITVYNLGGVPSGTVSTVLNSGEAGQFDLSQNSCVGQPLAGESTCTVTVTFHPTTPGGKGATLTVSATPGGTQAAVMSGTGTG